MRLLACLFQSHSACKGRWGVTFFRGGEGGHWWWVVFSHIRRGITVTEARFKVLYAKGLEIEIDFPGFFFFV